MLSPELLKKVHRLHIRTSHLVDAAFAGTYQSAFRGRGMEFQEVRQYVPGDDIRNIDWNVTAKTGEPHVKIFREERELTVMLLLDMSASGIFGSSHDLKRELIAEIAAVLAFSAIRNNDKIGVIMFTDQVEGVILPKKGRGHVWRVIREILSFESKSKTTNIGAALAYFNRIYSKRSICFLLSDFIDDHDFDRELSATAVRHDLISLVIRDKHEFNLPRVGHLNIVDPESGKTTTINTNSKKVRQQIEQLGNKNADKIKQQMNRAGARHVFVHDSDDYIHKLVELFHAKERTNG